MTQPIFLIGPRGCGKTTVGHALARARHFQFSDTDHRLQAHEQRTVAEIVQADGWERFRELVTLSLKGVTKAVVLMIVSFQQMPHPMVKKDAVGANATAKVKRSDFNMGKYAPHVGDEVTIDIAVEAIKQ